jgi:hypothetical protein
VSPIHSPAHASEYLLHRTAQRGALPDVVLPLCLTRDFLWVEVPIGTESVYPHRFGCVLGAYIEKPCLIGIAAGDFTHYEGYPSCREE